MPTRLLCCLTLCLLGLASQPGPAAPAVSDQYRIGAGDLLRVNVFGYPDMAADVLVDEAGALRYALVGTVQARGLSTRELEASLAQRLNDGGFIRNPQISVLVLEYRSQQVSVLGQVAKPGQFTLNKPSTVLDLLALAGGTLGASAADEATLLRAGGKQRIDLFALFQGDGTQNVPVQAGDTLFVPRAAQFYICGEVQRPGGYRLERNMTLSQAISAGGGLTARGTERRASVKRRDAHGRERSAAIRAAEVIQADDVLVIKESLF